MSFIFTYKAPWLLAEFEAPQRMLSWSITHPGFCINDRVAWLEVRNDDLNPNIDARDYMITKLEKDRLNGAVGLMTSRHIQHHHYDKRTKGFVKAQCLSTLGLSNGSHVGFPENHNTLSQLGTINSLCAVNVPLSDGALIEASSIATQARTAALLDFYREQRPDMRTITGTGTDCIVISCPHGGSHTMYAGLHTHVGKAIGETVYAVIREATQTWYRTHLKNHN
jgi:adenosylcobinamide amidohydrolase